MPVSYPSSAADVSITRGSVIGQNITSLRVMYASSRLFDEVVFLVCKVGFHLHHIGISFLPELLLPPGLMERFPGGSHLVFKYAGKFCVIYDVVIGLNGRKADFIFGLLFLADTHRFSRPGDFHVVDSLEPVEKVDSRRNGICVVERGRGDVCVAFRVDGTSKVIIYMSLGAYCRRKGRENGIPPVDLVVVVGGLLYPDFSGVGYGVCHTVL